MPWDNVPICERCWIEREAVWDENDSDVMVGLRLPVRLIEPDLEVCHFCGHPTFIGVFVRTQVSKKRKESEHAETEG